MEFFNKKEDVIDLQLTQFGRFLMSKGQFQPVFYSFFDDNVLYNYEKGGLYEIQNDSEQRIKDTQTMQPQISVSSLEKEFNTNYEMILTNQFQPGSQALQKTAEKNYALPVPVGTSDISSEYAPAWTIRYLNGHISSSVNYLDLKEKSGGKNTLLIPQLETNIKIEFTQYSSLNSDLQEQISHQLFDAPSLSDVVVTSDEEDYFVMLKVIENNGLYQTKNFDIEMYEVIEQIEGSNVIETLKPLHFTNPYNPEVDGEPYEHITPSDDPSYVAHYFDFFIDSEINPKDLCKYDPEVVKMGHHADSLAAQCQEILNQQQKVPFNIYEEGANDAPGEIC